MVNLKSKIYTIPIANPLVVGSCGLTNTPEKIETLEKSGAGAVILKSIFEEEINAQYKDELKNVGKFHEHEEFLDYFDYEIKNKALDKYCDLIKEAKRRVDIPIIASVNCYSSGNWIDYARPMEEAGADGIEVNAFFLPDNLEERCTDFELLYADIVSGLKKNLDIPVGIKIPPYFSNMFRFAHSVADKADGLTLFNRFYSSEIDIYNESVTSGPIFSSSQDYYNTMRWISLLSGRIDKGLSASVGIHKTETVIKMLLAGATSTQIVSSIYLGGPSVLKNMLVGIVEWMTQKGYSCLDDFVGKVSSEDAAKKHFERFQFMKYFGGHADQIDL